MSKFKKHLILLVFAAFVCIPLSAEISVNPTVDETIKQINSLPADDIWWTVNGKDMLWNFKNLNKIFPTTTIYRKGQVSLLKLKPNHKISQLPVDVGSGTMNFKDFLDSDLSTSMGVLILYKGDIVFEHYPRMQEHEQPVYWSVTKILVSSLISILEEQKKIDINKPIDFYLPELRQSDFKGILIKNILDMATGINCSEEYFDKSSCYYKYSETVGDGYWDESSPSNPYKYIANLDVGQYIEQGKQFDYSGVNTFVLGWLVEKITGLQFQDAFSQMIWTKIGAARDAAIFAPRNGIPVTHGGFMSTQRDLARFGLLFTPSYRVVSKNRLISEQHISYLLNQGRPELIRYGGSRKIPKEFKHNVYQWDMVYQNNDIYKGGWAGQGLIVNPIKDYVVVWNSYFKDKEESEIKLTPIIHQVVRSIEREK